MTRIFYESDATLEDLTDDISSGRFADEWNAERDTGHPVLTARKEQLAGPTVRDREAEIRRRLGPGVAAANRS